MLHFTEGVTLFRILAAQLLKSEQISEFGVLCRHSVTSLYELPTVFKNEYTLEKGVTFHYRHEFSSSEIERGRIRRRFGGKLGI